MLSRRQFAAASAAAVLSRTSPAAGPPKMVIDTHVHVWDLKQFDLPWLTGDGPLVRSLTLPDYEAATKGLSAGPIVYMEVDVAAKQKQAEADWIDALIRSGRSRFVGAVVGGYPASDGFKAYATQFKGSPSIKGLRQVMNSEATSGLGVEKAFVAGVRLLGQLGLTFDICVGHKALPNALALAEACPDTKLILDHCGNPPMLEKDKSAWKRDIEALGKCPNLVVKISGILAGLKPKAWKPADLAEVIDHCLDTFGPDRSVYASDWPVCNLGGGYGAWFEAVDEITAKLSAKDREKLFELNGIAFYGLKLPKG